MTPAIATGSFVVGDDQEFADRAPRPAVEQLQRFAGAREAHDDGARAA